jgi:hypothetical protein
MKVRHSQAERAWTGCVSTGVTSYEQAEVDGGLNIVHGDESTINGDLQRGIVPVVRRHVRPLSTGLPAS